MIVIRIENYMFVTEKKIETIINKKQKPQTLMKNINVQAHVKRYEGVDINDKVRLIKALNEAVENDRKQLVEDMKAKLAQLENGEIPAPPPTNDLDKPKRTRKKKNQPEEEQQQEEEISDEL
jgi:hypothetical protein